MEEQTLAELLYAAVFPVKKQGKGCSEERKIWNSFLDQLNQGLDASGCGAKAEAYTESEPYGQACGFHRDYGYFMVSCGDRGTKSVTILEAEAETAVNRFLALIIDKQAYQWVLDIKDREEASWPYHCRYDYRRLWFGKALEWLAPAVDWAVRRPVHRTAEPLVCAAALGIRLSDQPDHRDQRFQGVFGFPLLIPHRTGKRARTFQDQAGAAVFGRRRRCRDLPV